MISDRLRALSRHLLPSYIRLQLLMPRESFAAIQSLKLQPDDDAVQVIKDALQTHAQVTAALKSGSRVMVHHGATIVPLDLEHLSTPAKNRAGWTVIKGDKE